MRRPTKLKHITNDEWNAMTEEQQRRECAKVRIQTDEDVRRVLLERQHMTTIEGKQAGALSTEEKLERLIKFVNQLVEDHNELEKRVVALECGKQSEDVPLRPL